MTFGVISTGFAAKSLADIKTEIEQALKDTISPALDVSADGPLGQTIGIVSERLSENWEVAEALYRAFDPDNAAGTALGNLCSLTGITRLEATESIATVTCTGTPTTVLSVGRVVSTGASDRFASTAAATITAATAWAGTTAYVLTDIVANDGNIYVCSQAGTSAGAGGPTGTGDAIADNTAKWNFVGDGIGYADVAFEAEETGPIAISAGAIDTEDQVGAIETPVSGWEDARLLTDGTVGRDIETDAALRLRREEQLRITGAGALDASLDVFVGITLAVILV